MADTLVQEHRIAFFGYADELLNYWAWHDYTYWPLNCRIELGPYAVFADGFEDAGSGGWTAVETR